MSEEKKEMKEAVKKLTFEEETFAMLAQRHLESLNTLHSVLSAIASQMGLCVNIGQSLTNLRKQIKDSKFVEKIEADWRKMEMTKNALQLQMMTNENFTIVINSLEKLKNLKEGKKDEPTK